MTRPKLVAAQIAWLTALALMFVAVAVAVVAADHEPDSDCHGKPKRWKTTYARVDC